MIRERIELKLVATDPVVVGPGPEKTCKDLIDKWVEVGGTLGTGRKLSVQGTISGTSWFTLVANIVTPGGLFEIPQGVVKIRMYTDVVGSGPTTIYLAGLNAAREP